MTISTKKTCLVACQKIGGVTYHLMTTPDIFRCACLEFNSVVRLAVFELVVMNQQAQSKEKRTSNT